MVLGLLWQKSTSVERNSYLKLLQSNALTGTLEMESVFQWSRSMVFTSLMGECSGKHKSVRPQAISWVATSWCQLLGALHIPNFSSFFTWLGRMLLAAYVAASFVVCLSPHRLPAITQAHYSKMSPRFWASSVQLLVQCVSFLMTRFMTMSNAKGIQT